MVGRAACCSSVDNGICNVHGSFPSGEIRGYLSQVFPSSWALD